jgi:hypothetical protein
MARMGGDGLGGGRARDFPRRTPHDSWRRLPGELFASSRAAHILLLLRSRTSSRQQSRPDLEPKAGTRVSKGS